jgi:hypothetical protein
MGRVLMWFLVNYGHLFGCDDFARYFMNVLVVGEMK